MMNYKTIIKKLNTIKNRLTANYPIANLAVFGSYTRGEETPNSDIDILVELNGKIGIRFVDLADEIEQELGIKVDLVSRGGLSEKYFKEIESDLKYV